MAFVHLDSARLAYDIGRMRFISPLRIAVTLLAVGCALNAAAGSASAQSRRQQQAPQAPAQQLSPQDQDAVARAEQYLNSVGTAQARFAQTNPNGTISQGTFYIRRPGKMRFEYDPPSKLHIVADGFQVTMYDPATRDFGQWPIGWTAASFLVTPNIKLTGDITVQQVERAGTELRLTMYQTKRPQEGRIQIVFNDAPVVQQMQLKRWTIWDSKGVPVQVTLTEFRPGVNVSNDLFRTPEPTSRDR
jgi:outer membrane lipoprotein-sorting protein